MHKLDNKNLQPLTWKWSNEVLDKAVNAIVETVNYNHDFDIPYLAGYDTTGKIVYIDSDMPEKEEIKGKEYNFKRFLILHEVVEKALIDQLQLEYVLAHQIALRIEFEAVKAAGLSWPAYNDFTMKYVKEDSFKKIIVCPRDLDLAPYEDEKDYHLIEKIKSKMD